MMIADLNMDVQSSGMLKDFFALLVYGETATLWIFGTTTASSNLYPDLEDTQGIKKEDAGIRVKSV